MIYIYGKAGCQPCQAVKITDITHKDISLNLELPLGNGLFARIARLLEYVYNESISSNIDYEVRDKMRKEFNDKTELIMKELCDTANSNLQVVFNR